MEYQISNKLAALKPSAIREIFKSLSDPSIIAFAAGNPAAESFPVEALAEITADIFANEPVKALQYGQTEGYPPLREAVNKRLAEKFSIGCSVFGSDLKDKFTNLCETKDIPALLRKLLPVYVDGGLHWMVNECRSGGYYLTVFNHSGVERSVENGEYTLPEAEKTATITFKGEVSPALLEGDGRLSLEDGTYRITIPAGGFAFIKF